MDTNTFSFTNIQYNGNDNINRIVNTWMYEDLEVMEKKYTSKIDEYYQGSRALQREHGTLPNSPNPTHQRDWRINKNLLYLH